jgi:hypothetical protein
MRYRREGGARRRLSRYHEDPSRGLTDDRYSVVVSLVESYFLAGYEYFALVALQIADQGRLSSRFGT